MSSSGSENLISCSTRFCAILRRDMKRLVLIAAFFIGVLAVQAEEIPFTPVTASAPAVVALKDGDLYAIQLSDLSYQKLTAGGGFYTSNQWPYWASPDRTRFLTRQNGHLMLVTQAGAQPILQNEVTGDVVSAAWRSDSRALLVWHIVREVPGIAPPTESRLLTYDLEGGTLSTVKNFAGEFIQAVLWDADKQVIGYTVTPGEGGAFGAYHVLHLDSGTEQVYETRWINPQWTPDAAAFITFMEYDAQGSLYDTVRYYSILDPAQPLGSFQPPAPFFRCLAQSASPRCLGNGMDFWFTLGDGRLRSWDARTGGATDVASLPAGVVTLLDATADHRLGLIEQDGEYKVYEFGTGHLMPLGLVKHGTTRPAGETGSGFWTQEALGFIYRDS
jgi:hypothetical protein